MLKQKKWTAEDGSITKKNETLPVTPLFVWKTCYSIKTSYIEFVWCTNYPNVYF